MTGFLSGDRREIAYEATGKLQTLCRDSSTLSDLTVFHRGVVIGPLTGIAHQTQPRIARITRIKGSERENTNSWHLYSL
jgi:hypothetical protein